MNIRSKLIATLVTILVVTVITGSGYALFYIRAYLLEKAVEEMQSDGYWMMHTLSFLPDGDDMHKAIQRVGRVAPYEIALYDERGDMLVAYPEGTERSPHLHLLADEIQELLESEEVIKVINNPEDQYVRLYANLFESSNAARFFVINQKRSEIFEPITAVRNIITAGLLLSVIVILALSVLLAHYMARPLFRLTRDVQRISRGDTGHVIAVRRSDEIGMLAESVNTMAGKLRADFEHLQKLNEKQRQFFADITHEVRNPLHTIMGSLELLELPSLDAEKRQKYVKNLRSQARRIDRLFKDLVTLQRFDSDEKFVMMRSMDLCDITKNVAHWYHQAAKQKGVELQIDSHSCKVYADPEKIEQVLDNLISNAIKFTNKGSIEVRYEMQNSHVNVSVTDTGIGIPEVHWPRLFDRFYRTDKARSRDKGGTGLGLSVVKGILLAHGSDIQVQSEVGRGSRFSFKLPGSRQVHESRRVGALQVNG